MGAPSDRRASHSRPNGRDTQDVKRAVREPVEHPLRQSGEWKSNKNREQTDDQRAKISLDRGFFATSGENSRSDAKCRGDGVFPAASQVPPKRARTALSPRSWIGESDQKVIDASAAKCDTTGGANLAGHGGGNVIVRTLLPAQVADWLRRGRHPASGSRRGSFSARPCRVGRLPAASFSRRAPCRGRLRPVFSCRKGVPGGGCSATVHSGRSSREGSNS